jgi:hypothetical protein
MTRGGAHIFDPPPFVPLPDNVFNRQTHPSWHDAYARCTRLFFWAVGRQSPPGTASYDMCSRVLGHLILEAPTESGRDWVCKKILSCTDEHTLARLAQKYIFTFVGACAFSASHYIASSVLKRPFLIHDKTVKASAGRSLSSDRNSTLSSPNGERTSHSGYEGKKLLVRPFINSTSLFFTDSMDLMN